MNERKTIKYFKKTRYRKCVYCGKIIKDGELVTADHYIPYSWTKDTSISNLRVACEKCNQKKSNKHPWHFLALKRKANTRKIKDFVGTGNGQHKISKFIDSSVESPEDRLFIAKSDARELDINVIMKNYEDPIPTSMMALFNRIEG